MRKKIRLGFYAILILFSLAISLMLSVRATSDQTIGQGAVVMAQAQAEGLDPQVLQLGLKAYQHAKQMGLDKQNILTIIDYTKASTAPRLWVIDLNSGKILFNTLVAHGKGSGSNYATQFSNKPGTEASSIGVYITGKAYWGEHGYSLRLFGEDKGFNDNAYARTIVMHPAWYVSQSFATAHGYLGRSWGCTALDEKVSRPIISAIKEGTVILAYYPNQQWINSSTFLA